MRSADLPESEILKREPSSVAALARSAVYPRRIGRGGRVPRLSVERMGFSVDRNHLERFRKLTPIPRQRPLSLLYLHTLSFRYLMYLLSRPRFPLRMFTMMQIRNHVLLHAPDVPGGRLDLCSVIGDARPVSKGLEVDAGTVIRSNGTRVWESVNTFFFQGRYKDPAPRPEFEELAPLTDPRVLAKWNVPAGSGFRFARLSGDYNGIHYNSTYARMMGFNRSFCHAQFALAHCLMRLDGPPDIGSLRLDAALKGPVYYDAELVMRGRTWPRKRRFDLFCGENPRPVIVGALSIVSPDTRIADD